MKKYIVMLLIWAGICLLSSPWSTHQNDNKEVATTTSSMPVAEVHSKLP